MRIGKEAPLGGNLPKIDGTGEHQLRASAPGKNAR
jgi:hypothetical protein